MSLADFGAFAPVTGQCQLRLESGALKLKPYNGNKIIINGKIETVTSPTLVAASLTASTVYNIYAYMSSGTMMLEASTTAHSTDANTGIEIKTGDATRSFVGMAWASGVSTWGTGVLDVANWFILSRRPITQKTIFTTSRSTTSGAAVELHTEIRNNFLSWGDCDAHFSGTTTSSVVSGQVFTLLLLDSVSFIGSSLSNTYAGYMNANCAGKPTVSEGRHNITVCGTVASGTGTWVSDAGGIAGAGLLYVTVWI